MAKMDKIALCVNFFRKKKLIHGQNAFKNSKLRAPCLVVNVQLKISCNPKKIMRILAR